MHYNSNKDSAEEIARKLSSEHGVQAKTLQGDMTSGTFGTDMVAGILKAFPGRKIDILVNNAAYVGFTENVVDAPIDMLEKSLSANVRAPWTLVIAALPHLSAPGGRIVNVSSIVRHSGSINAAFYAASKAAFDSLAVSLAQEVAHTGITINGVAPGPIDTGLAPPDEHPAMQRFRAFQHVKRNGAPEEVAHAVMYLVHPRARFVSGQVVNVDGGITA